MRPSTKALLLATSALVPLGLAATAHANPAGVSVAAGTAQISGEGTPNLTVNQATDKAIINWHSFDIGNGETTQFVQPSTDSVTLNRVNGGLGSSQIDGALKANGKVFLINPDGILFGPNSMVDVGALVATTNDIQNDDFMAGRYVFDQPGKADASVVNAGSITAATGGFAALVAPGVRNSGTISARLGKVGLAAANGFTLDFYGDQLLTLNVGDEIAGTVKDVQTGQTLDALVKNEGALKADGGTVQLTAAAARQVVDSVINTEGIVEANSVGMKNGRIVLSAATADSKPAGTPTQKVKVSGKLSAAGKSPGETGGKVQITGEDIALNGATIDASGPAGGGKILIGGDVGGGHPNPAATSVSKAQAEDAPVPTATNVTVDPNSKIDVSAIDKGDGGKAVVWADFATAFAGTIYARGGPNGGDGGFAEISGKQSLDFGGTANLSAPGGAAGVLLFDPTITYQPGSAGTTDIWITNVYSYSDNYGVNGIYLRVGGWADYYNTLIRFNLSALPVQASSVLLMLYVLPDEGTPTAMSLSQITSSWDNQTGWYSQPTKILLSSYLPASLVGQWYTIDITQLYNSWQAGTVLNYGIELVPLNNNHNFNNFASSEYSDSELWPKLVISHSGDAVPSLPKVISAAQQAKTIGQPTYQPQTNLPYIPLPNAINAILAGNLVDLTEYSPAEVGLLRGVFANKHDDGYIYETGDSDPHQCVALVKALAQVGAASSWHAETDTNGRLVTLPSTDPSFPTIGTPIATFNSSDTSRQPFYPAENGHMVDPDGKPLPRSDGGDNNYAHATIFLGYIVENGRIVGMKILDQSENEGTSRKAAVTSRYFTQKDAAAHSGQVAGYPYSVIKQ